MIDALRLYWGTGLLLVAGAALALLAVLPISSLAERWSLVPRLGIETQHLTSMGFHWSANASTPADAERLGVQHLFLQLFISGMATLILSALTILSISAARASARTTEIAVRRAVGGSRRALFGSALVEGFAVAAVALMLGGVLGMLAARLAATSWPGSILHGRPSPNFAIVLVLAAILLIGTLFQLLTTTRKRVTEVPPKPLELYIPVVQLAMGLTVLTASALIIRHARAVIESGRLTADDGIVYSTDSPETSSEARSHRYQSLLTRLHQAPQVTTASLTSPGTTAGLGMVDAAMTDCGRCSDGGIPLRYHSVFAVHQFVSADTFSAVNLPVIAGRGISSSDTWESPPVAVVSKGMASRHFQEGDAIGRQIRLDLDGPRWYTVVGVAEDRSPAGLAGGVQPLSTVYLSILQHPTTSVELLIHGRGSQSLSPPITSILSTSLGGPVRLHQVSEQDLLTAAGAPLAWFGRWFAITGWSMLLIAAIGTFVLMRLWVISLRAELGVRRAVGARRYHIIGFILIRAAATGLAGVGVALWFGPALWDTLPEIIPGMAGWNASLMAPLVALLVAVATAGAFIPAWEAAYTDPARLIDSEE